MKGVETWRLWKEGIEIRKCGRVWEVRRDVVFFTLYSLVFVFVLFFPFFGLCV